MAIVHLIDRPLDHWLLSFSDDEAQTLIWYCRLLLALIALKGPDLLPLEKKLLHVLKVIYVVKPDRRIY